MIPRLKLKAAKIFTRDNWNIFLGLARANFKNSDYDSMLGISCSLLGPITILVVMYLVFKGPFGTGIKIYPLYLLIGIVFINFFIVATTCLIDTFSKNREMIHNSTVCREIVMLSNLTNQAFKFIIELIICWSLSIVLGVFVWKHALLLLPLLAAYIALIIGIGFIIALIRCFTFDITHIWSMVSRLLYFATPIFFTLNALAKPIQKLIYFVNPLTPFLISLRGVFMEKSVDMQSYFYSLALGAIFFTLGYGIFIVLENAAIEKV